MSIKGGPAAFLGALGFAALAGGLAYGVHTVAPVSEVREGSGVPAELVMSDDICTVMEGLDVSYDRFHMEWDEDLAVIADMTVVGQDLLDAVHGLGRTVLESGGVVYAYLLRGAELATDPTLAAAFRSVADTFGVFIETNGTPAVQAVDFDDYATATLAALNDPEFVAAIAEGDAALPILSEFALETCNMSMRRDFFATP